MWASVPDFAQFALFFVAALVLAVTPGPGIFYVAARTLAGGRQEGMASSFGTGLGGLAHVLAGSPGVSALVLASAELFSALKLVGAAYLVWLGWRTFRSARLAPPADAMATQSIGARRGFREGVLVEALNPKTAAFFLAFIPPFVNPAAGHPGLQFALLGVISVSLNTLADVIVALAASRIMGRAQTRPKVVRRLREASGGLMIALGVGLVFARRPGA
jgi:threonine/homoserine/homoserine lactone efflux protein